MRNIAKNYMLKTKQNKNGHVVWIIDKPNQKYEYFFSPDGSQYKLIEKISFIGFTKLPQGLNANGYGFSRGLKPLFYILDAHFNKINKFEIIKGSGSSIKKGKSGVSIIFSLDDYYTILESLNGIYQENSNRLSGNAQHLLYTLISKNHIQKINTQKYRRDTIAELLEENGIVDKLSSNDISKIASILPALIDKSIEIKQDVLKRLLFVDLKNKVNKIQLKTLIEDYEKLLSKKKQKEYDWQVYFKKNILFLNPGYASLIEKQNIGISIKLPDFLLIDHFKYIDVMEIKRPDMDPLQYDDSHKTYFWSTEASKALAQTERYIFEIEANAKAIREDLEDKGIKIEIIRPKGLVIIGKREKYKQNRTALKSFRILNEALKNTSVIFYDDFLELFKMKYSQLSK